MTTAAETELVVQTTPHGVLRQAVAAMPLWLNLMLGALLLAGVGGLLSLFVPELRVLVDRQSLADAFAPPLTSAGWLGTDQLGRPLEWRLLAGVGISVSVAVSVTVISVTLGLVMGILGGFFGKVADRAVTVVIDVAWAYPAILLAVVVAGVLGPGLPSVVWALGLSIWAAFARIVRAQVLSIRGQEYVLAARALGYGRLYIALHHLVPNLIPLGLVMASFYIAVAVIAEAGLSFIGLGAQPPTPSLGGVLAEGYTFVGSSPWPILTASLAIILLVMTFNAVGDYLRDALDPRYHKQERAPLSGFRRTRSGEELAGTTSASAPEDHRIIEVTDLTVVLDRPRGGSARVISNVSFDIQRGQTLGIVGESGSGKTVTARAVMGLLPSNLRMSGESQVLWDGDRTHELSTEEIRKRRGSFISMVFQDASASFDPLFSVGSQIGEVLKAHERLPDKSVEERVLETLARVGLQEPRTFHDRYPHQLSGGQLQRAMIAAALVLEPKVLIADEPTTGLDVTTQNRIVELVRRLQSEMDMAVVWITHDLELVSDLAERLVVMYAGEAVEVGPIDQVLGAPRHPYTLALLESRPQAAASRKAPLRTIQGGVPEPGYWPPACRFAPRCRRVLEACRDAHPDMHSSSDDPVHVWRCINPEPHPASVER